MTLPGPGGTDPAAAGTLPVMTGAMVGRGQELRAVVSELDRVAGGQPAGAILVVGACGTGKSRLIREVAAKASEYDVLVLRGHCVGRGAEPLLPVREALSAFLGSTPERIKQVIKQVAPKLLDLVPFVGRFLAPLAEAIVAGPQLGGSGLNGVYAGLEQVFHGLAERKGLCLIVEDAHDADQDTLYFLTYLLEKAAATHAIAILSLDENELDRVPLAEIFAGWLVEGWKRVDLHGLSKAEVTQFVTLATGEQPDQSLLDRLYDLTGGNSLLLQELLPVMRSGAASQIEMDITALTLPNRVQALLDRRLMHLDKATRAFLEAAAICLEDNNDLRVVASTLRLDEDELLGRLDECSRLGLMIEPVPGRVKFVHEAMRLAVYSKVPQATRRRLHSRAAQWYEANDLIVAAVHHYESAGQMDDLVRTVLIAGAAAERAGIYRSAALLYRKARPDGALPNVAGVPLARCLIVLGEWEEAESLLRDLPRDSAAIRLLWSDLHFVRGQIRTAAADLEDNVPAEPEARLDCLIRLADIYLYLGEFDMARRYAQEALITAQQSDSPTDQARGLGIMAATLFFGGNIDNAERAFRQAYDMVDAIPEELRDRTHYTVLLGNLGQVAEARGDWRSAEELHRRALTIRREVFDARGLLQSLHALARAWLGAGVATRAIGFLDEADQLASRLGEPLELAKIALTRAKFAFATGDTAAATDLAEGALAGFSNCGTAFDVAHARLALARMRAPDDEAATLVDGAAARAAVNRLGFGLLRHEFPDLAFSYRDRILAALHAYACGDAFGLPTEGLAAAEVDLARAEALTPRPGWARGATSDDTSLTLLVAEALTATGNGGPAGRFMTLLDHRAPHIQGLGPSTLAALDHYRRYGEPPHAGGETNGAVMRSLPIGWAIPFADPERRRSLTVEMSAVTHPSPKARSAAVVMSACAAWALEGASPRRLLEVAREEASLAEAMCGAGPGIEALLEAVAEMSWSTAPGGVSLDPYDTVAAVLHCVAAADCLQEAVEAAVRLGGDTDTVAALVAGLLGSQMPLEEIRSQLPWYGAVLLPDSDLMATLADGMASARHNIPRG